MRHCIARMLWNNVLIFICIWVSVSVLTTLSLCNTEPSRWDAVAWRMKTNTPFYKCRLLSSKAPVLMTAWLREWKLSVASVERQQAIFNKGLKDHHCNLVSGMWAVEISGILNILTVFYLWKWYCVKLILPAFEKH